MGKIDRKPLKAREITYLILAVLNILYGILVRAIHSTHISFVIWIGIGMFFIICFILSRKGFFKKIPMFLRVFICLILLAGFILFSFIEANIIKGMTGAPPKGLDYIIVLGAKIYGTEPSPSLRYRLDAALAYLKDNPETICILSGGQGQDEIVPEAEIMYEYMINNGIPEYRIRIDSMSKDTAENISNSIRFMSDKNDSVGLVSSSYHIYRATLIAKNQGLTDVCGVPSKAPAAFIPHNMMKEFLSLLKAFITGNG